jgi:hypothetical protein
MKCNLQPLAKPRKGTKVKTGVLLSSEIEQGKTVLGRPVNAPKTSQNDTTAESRGLSTPGMPQPTRPFLSCLSWDSLALLDAALFYNHRRHIVRPAPAADLMDFDAGREMRQQPESEEHMKA